MKWSPTGKARGTCLTPERGDIPAKSWRIHPRPKAMAFCCRGEPFDSPAFPSTSFGMVSMPNQRLGLVFDPRHRRAQSSRSGRGARGLSRLLHPPSKARHRSPQWVNPVRNSSRASNPAGIILGPKPATEQRGIISNGVKEITYCPKFFL